LAAAPTPAVTIVRASLVAVTAAAASSRRGACRLATATYNRAMHLAGGGRCSDAAFLFLRLPTVFAGIARWPI
jgi:hypothetical protein